MAKKRREKTAQEFADSLMAYLGKKSYKATMEYSMFRISLAKYNSGEASGKDNTGIHFPQKTGEEFTSQDNLKLLHFMAADLCILLCNCMVLR